MPYKINETQDKNGKLSGFRLITWEPAKVTLERLQPYLFKVNLDFQTKSGAIAYANQINGNQAPLV